MTFLEIYNQVCFNNYGTSTVEAGVQAMLQGERGVISNAHRALQDEYNFWFMEQTETTAIDETSTHVDLPDNFKKDITVTFIDSDGKYHEMIKLAKGEMDRLYTDKTQKATVPVHFNLVGEELQFFPMLSEDVTGSIMIRYFGYLDRIDTFDGGTDELCTYGGLAIVFKASADMAMRLRDFDAMNAFKTAYLENINSLLIKDAERKNSIGQMQYCDH